MDKDLAVNCRGRWFRSLGMLLLLCLTVTLVGCGVSFNGVDSVTEVQRLPSENLTRFCDYELILAKPTGGSQSSLVQNGVFVVYQRGDSSVVFGDPAIRQLLQTMQFSLVLADQCDAATYDDFQSDPFSGPGRELFQALNQFAGQTGHPELATANVVLYGFSAGGVLAAEMATYKPSRILGVISYAAGSAYQDFASFIPSSAALGVPSLFLANSEDEQSGTTRNLDYFVSGRKLGAIWGYAVQEGVGHCCNITTVPMILGWLPSILELRGGGHASPLPVSNSSGVEGFFVCTPDGTIDAQKDEDCSIDLAAIGAAPEAAAQSVWLPGTQAANAWLAWIAPSQGGVSSVTTRPAVFAARAPDPCLQFSQRDCFVQSDVVSGVPFETIMQVTSDKH